MHEQYHHCHPLGRRVRELSNTVSRPFGNTSRLMTKCPSRIKFYYRPQTKLRKGNVFTPVCQSFCSGGGCLPSAYWVYTPLGRHPTWADTPWADTTLEAHTPLLKHPPGSTTPPSRRPQQPTVRFLLECFLVYFSIPS